DDQDARLAILLIQTFGNQSGVVSMQNGIAPEVGRHAPPENDGGCIEHCSVVATSCYDRRCPLSTALEEQAQQSGKEDDRTPPRRKSAERPTSHAIVQTSTKRVELGFARSNLLAQDLDEIGVPVRVAGVVSGSGAHM